MSSHLSKQQRTYPPTFGDRRLRGTFKPKRVAQVERDLNAAGYLTPAQYRRHLQREATKRALEEARRRERRSPRSFVTRLFRRRSR